jgi:hypothetical protein
MKRNTTVLCLVMFGTIVEARAECPYVRGGITETIIPSPNDPLGRVLGNVDGVLNGASTNSSPASIRHLWGSMQHHSMFS